MLTTFTLVIDEKRYCIRRIDHQTFSCNGKEYTCPAHEFKMQWIESFVIEKLCDNKESNEYVSYCNLFTLMLKN